MSADFDWLILINRTAALKEQFPPLAKVMRERPGSATDARKQRLIAEENQLSKARRDLERWRESSDANARREQRLSGERRRRAYNRYQADKHQEDKIA